MIKPIRSAFWRIRNYIEYVVKSWYDGWRIIRGVLSLLVPFLSLGLLIFILAYTDNRYDIDQDSFWGLQQEWLMEITPSLFVTMFIAAFIVYFLRLLYWLRTNGKVFWNKETAPHHQGRYPDDDRPRVNRPLSESKFKFLQWSVLSLLIWLTFGIMLILASAIYSVIDWGIPEFYPSMKDVFIQFSQEVPLIGQIIVFEYYPGSGPIQTVSYFIGAIPAAIAIRNLVFVFENINKYGTTEDENLLEVVIVSCSVVIGVVLIFALIGFLLGSVFTFGILLASGLN